MVSDADVAECWAVLQTSGLRPPDKLNDEGMVDVALRTWRAVLADVEPAELRTAVVLYLRSAERWWPTPGQLLQLVQPPAEDHADRAWGELVQAVTRRGSYQPPATSNSEGTWVLSDDPLRRVAMEAGLTALGGWTRVCATLSAEDDNAPMRASFRSAYRAEVKRQERDRQMASAALIGARSLLPALPPPVIEPPRLIAEGGRVLTDAEQAERQERRRLYLRRQEEARARLRALPVPPDTERDRS